MGSEVKRRILMGTYTLSAGYADAYYERACEVRELVSAELNSKLLLYDALLTPVSTSIAPKLSTSLDNPLDMYTGDAMTVNVNLSGLPALVVRGNNVSNSGVSLPVGVQLIGRAFDETKLLTIGSIYERASYEKFELQQFAAKV
jgi:aspartyl-tRNA(Asn)/glutamyl-tRNA(Gln) amidotransferase subunit A